MGTSGLIVNLSQSEKDFNRDADGPRP